MPSINVRLSEKQHEELKRRAGEGDRSIQRQVLHDLFSERPVGASGATEERAEGAGKGEGPPRATLSGDGHFRPDFGSKLKR